MRGLVLAFAAAFTLAHPGRAPAAASPEKVRFATMAGDISEIDGYLLRPEGEGPFPAVIALHGCSGLLNKKGALTSRHDDWGKRLRDAGYVVIFPDSFGPRGHKSLCKVKDRPVKHSHRIGDIQGAADWLGKQGYVDRSRVALLGWSNGGTSVLRALEPGKAPSDADFRTVIAFYPACRWALKKSWTPRLKPLVLMGAADDWTPAEPCKQLAQKWRFRLVLYKGAYHAFDAPNSPVRVLTGRAFSVKKDGTVHVGTDLLARAAAITEVMGHLKSVFSPGE